GLGRGVGQRRGFDHGGVPRRSPEMDPAGAVSTAAVDDVRVEIDADTGAERVVYVFAGSGIPFWKAGYVAEAVPYRGGPTLPVPGRAIMQVDIMGTAPPARHPSDAAVPVVTPDGSRVTQLFVLPDVRDANGITQSFIGLRPGPVPFEVVTVEEPPQLIIEFR
uniref:AMIN-like domain-containing (lipo)protein n=1 Tax=Prescottella defluvii TaxID=1323361 RepID=UPI001E5263F8